MDGIRRTTYFWGGVAFAFLGAVSTYATVAFSGDVVSGLLVLPFSLLPLVLGVLFVRRARNP